VENAELATPASTPTSSGAKLKLVDVGSLTKIAKDDLGLLPQPAEPAFKCSLVQIYVRSQPYGGSDKSSNGHRYDSIPFANGMITSGMSCQLIHYVHQEHDKFFEVCKSFDALIVRCNPGQIDADGGSQSKFDDALRGLRKRNIQVWPSPDVMEFMGAKDALVKVKDLNIGLPDTLAYYSAEEFAAGFKKTMAFQPRVVKQNRGSSGEGIWIIKLKEGNYCKSFGERNCGDAEVLSLMEANDNHSEEHTVAEFMEFCVNGRSDKSGEWTSKGVGKYLAGGKEAGGPLDDQRFCPRIVEGELRYNMVMDSLVGIIHKKPKEGGISAVGGTGSIYTYYGPEEVLFKNLTEKFLEQDLQKVMPALGLAKEPIPLWWTTDFINASPEGTKPEDEQWIVGEFNCSCVGISKCLAAYCKEDTPNACYDDISESDRKDADAYGKLMGEKALSILTNNHPSSYPVDISAITRVAKNDDGLLAQPDGPLFNLALVEIYVRNQPHGGSDKSSNGHRYDSIPFANGCINANLSCQLMHYRHEEHDKFVEVCSKFHALIVRCNPGQIKADGGDQGKFDNAMRDLRKKGVQVWPSPDVMEQMGAKDALVKVASLNIGLEDTLAYYTESDFAAGFKKTMAFQPRVIKQNRGSSGEGIWIIKLKAGNYCTSYGERSCEDGEILDMMEANDNHNEEHTVAEFIEFCVRGRSDKSGEWTSKGVGKYLEGGKDAGGQLVDQRFCPRIVEGELRYNMVVDELVGIIHKKPKEGGISAVGGTGSIYTYYGPKESKFETLTTNFLKRDLEKVMPALGLASEPIPLWWTTDFILASPEGTPVKDEKWIVGEFNCSCVGISKCLAAYCKDDTPEASFKDIAAEDLQEAMGYGDLMGKKAVEILSNAASGPVDVSAITKVAKDDLGLLPQPGDPKFKAALVQIYIRGQPYGGSDKSSNGHRYDTIPIANGLIGAGVSCQLIHYVHDEHDKFVEVCKGFDALVVRCNPGHINADGGSQQKFDDAMRQLRKAGKQVWPSPDVMEQMGAKDALCKIANMSIGLEDTAAYYDEKTFATGFKKTMAFQPRVIKQNRGSSGEGIWIIKLKKGDYCASYGKRSCQDKEVLVLQEANDNHVEEHTVAQFIEFCVNGRTGKSGTWTSKGEGKYLAGGKAAGGQLVDQRFCPRIVEGELRYNCVADELVGIIHKKPKEGGISAVSGTGSIYTFYGPDEPRFANLTDSFIKKDMSKIMPALGLASEPIPLWWTTDFINSSPPGTDSKNEKWIVGEFNCSCVGISKCLAAFCKDDTPNATYDDISAEDKAEAKKMGDLMGKKALSILSSAQ
jgi:glutathione synthase/RimK-type ligase-like ATP-grasp enzyme/predicted nucleic acid binding AN1-type Zn finger protein